MKKTKAYKCSRPSNEALDDADQWFITLKGCPCAHCERQNTCQSGCKEFFEFWGKEWRKVTAELKRRDT